MTSPKTPLATRVLDGKDVTRIVSRMAHDIRDGCLVDAEGPLGISAASLTLVGIRTGGAHLAERVADEIGRLGTERPPVGILDITLYRDDAFLAGNVPVLRGTEIPFDIEGRYLVLIDDVLFTGRTVRAALDALLDLGRPGCVRLAVLIDRGLRELPIAADFVGRSLSTRREDRVEVHLRETGAPEDEVVITHAQNRRRADEGDDSGDGPGEDPNAGGAA